MTETEKALGIIKKAKEQKRNSRNALKLEGFTDVNIEKYIHLDRTNNNLKRSGVDSTDNCPGIKYTEDKKSATLESKGNIRTLEALLQEAKVDLNIWIVDRHVINKWEVGAKDSKDIIQVTPLWQVKVWLKKKHEADTTKELIEWFRTEMSSCIPINKWNEVKKVDRSNLAREYCLELAVPDLHIGKLSWSEETGWDNYDSNEAIRIFKNAISNLVEKAPMTHVGRILFPVGNDFFNVDGADEATSSGTPQSEDSRWQNTFKKGCKLLQETITQLAINTPVDVLLVSGNHDYERSFYLGEYLSAYFKDHPNVFINNNPTLRKYYKYGQTLIGFSHGDKEVRKNLPLIMATERKVDWTDTNYKEWHLGHFHKEADEEHMGVKVRTLPSLCSADSWHASKGYIGQTRCAKAFLFHIDRGLEAQYYYNL